MPSVESLPGLVAVLEPDAPRSETLRLRLRRRELEQLRQFATTAAIPPGTLAHRLIAAGLHRLLVEQLEAQQAEA
jgi:hypothetical protein